MKKVLSLILSLILMLGLTACGDTPTSSSPASSTDEKSASAEPPGATSQSSTEKEQSNYRIAVLVWAMAEEFGTDVVTGATNAAERLGVEIMSPDPAGDMQKEISIIEDLIQQDIDAVCIAPVDAEAIGPYIDKMRDAGIVVVDYDIETDAVCDAYIMSDHYKGGQDTAAVFLEKHGTSGKVLIVDDVPGVTTAELRNAGFEDYLKENAPDIEIIHQLSTGTRDTHRSTIENMLTAHPDLTGIFCFMGDIAIPAYHVLNSVGRDDIILAAYDATPEQVEIMKNDGPDCQMVCSVALYPKNIGRVAMETAVQLLDGELESGVRIETVNGMLTPENASTFEDLEKAQ